MAAVKVYLDEDVHPLIADVLRLRGWETLTTLEADQRGASDLEQIRFAAEMGYAIVSYNIADFPRLHYELVNAGRHHAGIIVATQENPAANARTLLKLVSTFAAEDFVDQLVFLNNWR